MISMSRDSKCDIKPNATVFTSCNVRYDITLHHVILHDITHYKYDIETSDITREKREIMKYYVYDNTA